VSPGNIMDSLPAILVVPARITIHAFALLALVFVAQTSTWAKPSFAIRPEPAWVRQFEINRTGGSQDRPTSILLEDRETKLSTNTVERFFKHSERVNTIAGLERVSQLRFYFEPSYQSLAIHFIRIIRSGQVTNALDLSAIKIIAKEDDLDEQIYNGTFAAIVFLKDVRVGDVVEYAFSVTGDNPVFAGHFADHFYVAADEPIQTLSFRLIAPASRTLYFHNQGSEIAPTSRLQENDKEYLWERANVPAIATEDQTPVWFEAFPSVWVSEFPDWQSVVQWAAPLFDVNQPLPPEMKNKAEGWLKQFARPEQRIIAALRFVQQEIRYLGIELGPYSHRPAPPSQTIARRFGDCKDKSLLLHATLRFMGIDSAIALVNSSARRSLDDYEPSPEAFDHAIVQIKIGDRTLWVDPTMESQRGNIDAYYDPPYERALVLRPEVRSLETIPQPNLQAPTTDVQEVYTAQANGQVSLHVTTIYRAADADEARYRWSQRSAEEMGKSYLNYYAKQNPSIRAEGPPHISDSEEANIVTIEEKYIIDSFWTNDWHYFNGDAAYSELPKPNISQRTMPLALHHPTFVRQTIQIDSLAPGDTAPHSEVISNDAFRFEYTYQPAANSVRITYSLKTLRDYITPQKAAAYLAEADRIWNSTGVQLSNQSVGIVRRSPSSFGESLAAFLLLLVGAVVVGALIVIKRRRERRQPFTTKPTPGVAPESAMRCKDRNEIEAFTKGFKCRCGGHPYTPDALSQQETLIYDGERLATIKVKCDSCGRATDLYFVQPPVLAEN
jgi:Domain of Unknown Function with PDB structure (DUF3857)